MTASSDSTNLFTGAAAGRTASDPATQEKINKGLSSAGAGAREAAGMAKRGVTTWNYIGPDGGISAAGTAADAERLFRAHLDAADETASPREGFRSTFKSENICELDRDGTWFERFDDVIKPGEVQVVAAGHHG